MNNQSPKLMNSYIPVKSAANSAMNTVSNIVNNATNNVAKVLSPANNALNSLRNTAASATKTVSNAANNFGNAVTNKIQNTAGNLTTPASTGMAVPWLLIGIAVLFIIIVVLLVVFYNDIKKALPSSLTDIFEGPKKSKDEPTPNVVAMPNNVTAAPPATMVDNLLPGKKEVFNVSSNKYIYSDAEPLCKALGAELATYDQVKDAFDKGADWCNYGWTKGQLALYPTQDATWQKLQLGPEGQRQACGRPGLNGGYFDNPEMRFGVNCYGSKPKQSAHDSAANMGAPISPDALDFDKKVSMYRSDADDIGVLPFRDGAWTE